MNWLGKNESLLSILLCPPTNKVLLSGTGKLGLQMPWHSCFYLSGQTTFSREVTIVLILPLKSGDLFLYKSPYFASPPNPTSALHLTPLIRETLMNLSLALCSELHSMQGCSKRSPPQELSGRPLPAKRSSLLCATKKKLYNLTSCP